MTQPAVTLFVGVHFQLTAMTQRAVTLFVKIHQIPGSSWACKVQKFLRRTPASAEQAAPMPSFDRGCLDQPV